MNTSEFRSRLSKSVDFLKSELSQIKTGRASPQMISDISIEVYEGTSMTVKEVGTISVVDPHTMIIIPWDKNVVSKIAQGIRDSDTGVSASEEVGKVRVTIPTLTEERRVEYAKEVDRKVEECKSSIRNIRQEAMKDIDKDFDTKVISEDEKFRKKEEIEDIVKEQITATEKTGESKRKEIMTV
ncbi:ribosome-recycling factor [Patescibacteria group bacterium]